MAKYKLCMSDKNEPIFISDGVVVQDVKTGAMRTVPYKWVGGAVQFMPPTEPSAEDDSDDDEITVLSQHSAGDGAKSDHGGAATGNAGADRVNSDSFEIESVECVDIENEADHSTPVSSQGSQKTATGNVSRIEYSQPGPSNRQGSGNRQSPSGRSLSQRNRYSPSQRNRGSPRSSPARGTSSFKIPQVKQRLFAPLIRDKKSTKDATGARVKVPTNSQPGTSQSSGPSGTATGRVRVRGGASTRGRGANQSAGSSATVTASQSSQPVIAHRQSETSVVDRDYHRGDGLLDDDDDVYDGFRRNLHDDGPNVLEEALESCRSLFPDSELFGPEESSVPSSEREFGDYDEEWSDASQSSNQNALPPRNRDTEAEGERPANDEPRQKRNSSYWSPEEKLDLIRLYAENRDRFYDNSTRKQDIWREISREFPRHTGKGCNNKWNHLLAKYKTKLDSMGDKATGQAPVDFPLFDAMDAVLRREPQMVPSRTSGLTRPLAQNIPPSYLAATAEEQMADDPVEGVGGQNEAIGQNEATGRNRATGQNGATGAPTVAVADSQSVMVGLSRAVRRRAAENAAEINDARMTERQARVDYINQKKAFLRESLAEIRSSNSFMEKMVAAMQAPVVIDAQYLHPAPPYAAPPYAAPPYPAHPYAALPYPVTPYTVPPNPATSTPLPQNVAPEIPAHLIPAPQIPATSTPPPQNVAPEIPAPQIPAPEIPESEISESEIRASQITPP